MTAGDVRSQMRANRGRVPLAHRMRVLRWVAVAAWALFIWSRSLFAGPESTAQSDAVVALVRPALAALGVADADLMSFLVRKTGHFLEYAALGALLAWASPSARVRAMVAALAIATTDEAIQLFVPGRTGAVRDVLIDLVGAILGLAVVALARRMRGRAKSRRSKA